MMEEPLEPPEGLLHRLPDPGASLWGCRGIEEFSKPLETLVVSGSGLGGGGGDLVGLGGMLGVWGALGRQGGGFWKGEGWSRHYCL